MTAPRPVRAAPGTVEFRAIVDAAVPPIAGLADGRSMVSRWDDHLRPGDHRETVPTRRPADLDAKRETTERG